MWNQLSTHRNHSFTYIVSVPTMTTTTPRRSSRVDHLTGVCERARPLRRDNCYKEGSIEHHTHQSFKNILFSIHFMCVCVLMMNVDEPAGCMRALMACFHKWVKQIITFRATHRWTLNAVIIISQWEFFFRTSSPAQMHLTSETFFFRSSYINI